MSGSTLSTGLNKSEAFIKDNAIDIHTRELNFKNNEKIYLNEDTEIPAGKGIKRYICCLTIGYFENYQICHHTLSIWVYLRDGTIKTASILPSEKDRNGLLQELSKNLSTIGVYLLYNKQINGYQGFLLSLDDHMNITKIESSYHFAWLMNIITKYDSGMGSNDKKVLFNSGFATYVDLIGLETQFGNTRVRNKICTKTIYPRFNGGINRITVSSDLLATTQYINRHKTATIAELQIGPSTNAQINPMEIQDSFDWKHE